MDEDGGVFPRRRLQAELRVRRLGVVGEGDGVGQLAIVQHLLVVLGQVDVTLRLELEGALSPTLFLRKCYFGVFKKQMYFPKTTQILCL